MSWATLTTVCLLPRSFTELSAVFIFVERPSEAMAVCFAKLWIIRQLLLFTVTDMNVKFSSNDSRHGRLSNGVRGCGCGVEDVRRETGFWSR